MRTLLTISSGFEISVSELLRCVDAVYKKEELRNILTDFCAGCPSDDQVLGTDA